jgi:hypothetical protein
VDRDLPEIALDLAPIQESRGHFGVENPDFEMDLQVPRTFTERNRHVSPGLDFYHPQLPSRRLGEIRGDVQRMRSAVAPGGKKLVVDRPAGYSQAHRGQDPQRRIPNNTTGKSTSKQRAPSMSRLAMALREEEKTQPVVKFRPYRALDGPMAGPSNEVFLGPEEVGTRRRWDSRIREDERLEEEARCREEARINYHRFRR